MQKKLRDTMTMKDIETDKKGDWCHQLSQNQYLPYNQLISMHLIPLKKNMTYQLQNQSHHSTLDHERRNDAWKL